MKHIFFILLLGMALVACNNQEATPGSGTADSGTAAAEDSTRMTIQIPKSGCYLYTSGRDTIALKIEVFPNVVTGVLNYQFYEKDRNTGEIDGVLKGDTLLADYSFLSEGTRSTRQVAFLIGDSIVSEGYGEMEEKSGKMVFRDASKLDFSKGTQLRQISCLDYDRAQRFVSSVNNSSQPAVDDNAAGGSEMLYSFQWNLSELGSTAIEKDPSSTIPHLLMFPGQRNAVSGNTGCNSFRGSFGLSGKNSIKFSPLATTRKACVGKNYETEFLAALEKATSWQVKGKQLVLLDKSTSLAKFVGVTPDPKSPATR